VIVGDASGTGANLAERLRARGDAAVVVREAGEGTIAAAIREADADPARPLRGVVHLAALQQPRNDAPTGVLESARDGVAGLLEIVRILAGRPAGGARVWTVTRGAQPVAGTGAVA